VTYLAGRLPATGDSASYVWGFWWVAHQVTHLGNPWFTSYLAAPVGAQLGFDTLMPLPGTLMTPVTLAFGPAATLNLLVVTVPGLLCYLMYRAARLWLPQAGAIAAGAFFGLSTMITFQDWYHLNIAIGQLFLPMALEAAVRLRRQPGTRQAVLLGLVLGGVVLVNQESAVLTWILAGLVLTPWLLRRRSAGLRSADLRPDSRRPAGLRSADLRPDSRRPASLRPASLRPAAFACLTAAIVASPQIAAMVRQVLAGGARAPGGDLPHWYAAFGPGFLTLVAPSPRISRFGLGHLASWYDYAQVGEGVPTFGLVLSVLAVLGAVITWRRTRTRYLTALWIGSAALALGPVIRIGNRRYVPFAEVVHGVRLSEIMPYTWFVQLPGMSAFREADRLALLGMVPAALLAGSAVDWLRCRARPVLAVAAGLAVLELGYSSAAQLMPATMAALDRPIAADHSPSIVVDVPFGLRGGLPAYGSKISPEALVLATADAHPRAVSYTSWVPAPSIAGVDKRAFYARLVAAQHGHRSSAAQLRSARTSAARMDVGWALVWHRTPDIVDYLRAVGFHFAYRADRVSVYRPPASWHRAE
jgi:hypothetical protein